MTPASPNAASDPLTMAAQAAPLVRGGIGLAGPAARDAAATRTARDFEAFFVTSMLESMTAGLKPDKLFGGGPGESMYRSLMNQEYGKAIAARGSLGIADEIKREMLRLQEQANP